MKKAYLFVFIMVSALVLGACTTYRGTAAGGCSVNRNMVGYR